MKRCIGAFGRWFASTGCVWQTTAACLALVAAEARWPSIDPHFFYLLLALTIYSAVTQPVLAYVGMLGAQKTDEVLARLTQLERDELAQLVALRDALTAGAPGTAKITPNGVIEVKPEREGR